MEKENKAPSQEEKVIQEPAKQLTEVEQLKLDLETAKKEAEDNKNKYLFALADYENLRKRTQKELEEAKDRAIINFVLDLLPAIDNFEMSLKMTSKPDLFIKGVEMIHKNLTETLKEHHIESYETKLGENFDTLKHDPLPLENKEAQPGKVLAILSKGYKHKKDVIRPAKVQIKKEG
jgi:molecular chaperone GrpE